MGLLGKVLQMFNRSHRSVSPKDLRPLKRTTVSPTLIHDPCASLETESFLHAGAPQGRLTEGGFPLSITSRRAGMRPM